MSKVITHVRWVDSLGSSRWRPRNETKSDRKQLDHESIGYILEETEYSLVLLQSQQRHGEHIDNTMEIPKVAIVERRDYTIEDFED
jgi:hypothetical protein